MKLLRELLYGCPLDSVYGDTNIAISNIFTNSNEVEPLGIFVAINGIKINGHKFINQAISAGAVAIICEELPKKKHNHVTYVKVVNSSYALGLVASNFFNNPSSSIKLIGITGTNGKTSVAYYLFELFQKLNFNVGLISTIENKINNQSFESTHTTPNALEINKLLSLMVEEGCEFCFMEVSSHGIDQNRIVGLNFNIAIFSNISRDHLDYHNSFEQYKNTKKKFFDNLNQDAISIVNKDDTYSSNILLDTKSKKIFYGIHSKAHYKASIIESNLLGLSLEIDRHNIATCLIGDFNAYNLLAVYAVARQLGQDSVKVLKLLSSVSPVPGRFNIIRSPKHDVVGIVDYAHTPDALQKVILSISNFCNPIKDLIIVLGCGGNRDQGKRPIMGKIAFQASSQIIFTSDNPRFEDPQSIIDDMCLDLPKETYNKVHKIQNREEAIHFAFNQVNTESVVLVAGKGHEKFQEIRDNKQPFDDAKIITNILNT